MFEVSNKLPYIAVLDSYCNILWSPFLSQYQEQIAASTTGTTTTSETLSTTTSDEAENASIALIPIVILTYSLLLALL